MNCEMLEEKMWALTQCFPGSLKLMTFTLLESENKLSDSLRKIKTVCILGILAIAAAKAKPSESALYCRFLLFSMG